MTNLATARPGHFLRAVRRIAAGLLLTALAAPSLNAQTPGSGLATSYAANADKPIDIVADVLEVDDKQKLATFKGNVSATQGDFNLRAKEVQVTYTSKDRKAASAKNASAVPGGGNADITRIDAKGKVLVTTKEDQTATSDWAIFDVTKQTVTIGGNVVLTQGPNTIKGSRLVIDLKTGLSRFENNTAKSEGGKPRERLRAIFTPKSRPGKTN
jgi:lipopolysaccharide export system protein LptA